MGVEVRSFHKRIAVYKQGWALVPVRESTDVLLGPQVANSCILVSATVVRGRWEHMHACEQATQKNTCKHAPCMFVRKEGKEVYFE